MYCTTDKPIEKQLIGAVSELDGRDGLLFILVCFFSSFIAGVQL